jgi:hypothetical protein
MIIAQNKTYNAGHTVYTLVQSIFDSLTSEGEKINTYALYNNSCPIWYGTSREEGLAEFNKLL